MAIDTTHQHDVVIVGGGLTGFRASVCPAVNTTDPCLALQFYIFPEKFKS